MCFEIMEDICFISLQSSQKIEVGEEMQWQTQNMLCYVVLSLQNAHAAIDCREAEDEVQESVN